ncbi:MAG: permease-like cell division protein FtsX [Patescibacteria group bacterium]|jgi:cell division transport system permease protein
MAYIWRLIKLALQDFSRNIWLSLVTISILILTLISINVLVVFNAMTGTAVKVISDKVNISVYFKPGVSEEAISKMKADLVALPETAEVDYTSADEAAQAFKNRHEGDTAIIAALDELGTSPLGATLRIKARQLSGYPALLAAVNQPQYNELIANQDYNDRQEMIAKISEWTAAGKKIALVFIVFFILISALIVFNTVRVAIYTHRDEIGIEKLVGATNWFVSLPFVIESALYGLIAIVVIMAITYPGLTVIQPYLARFFGAGQINVLTYFNQHFLAIFGSEFLVITLLNILASVVAARKYLKV